MKQINRKAFLGVGFLAAIASSLCCIVPLIAVIAGISGAASSTSWIEPLRPWLIGFTIICLSYAWYLKLKPAKLDDCDCEIKEDKSFLQSTGFLLMISILSLVMIAFPYYSSAFYVDEETEQETQEVQDLVYAKFSVEGMTCTGCESKITYTLDKQPGVHWSSANFNTGLAEIKFDSSKNVIEKLEEVLEEETGYQVSVLPYPQPKDNVSQ